MSRSTMHAHRKLRILRRTAAAGVVTAALALSACAGGQGGAEPGEDGLTPVTVVTFLPLESLSFAPEMLAYSGGYFEDHGLDVTLEPVQGAAAAVQSVIGGAALITRAGMIDLMPAMEQGQPLLAVGTMTRHTILRVVSTSENPIESAADMAGKTIGLASIGGTSEKTLDLALRAGDVDPESVERQAVPVTAATYELVKQGQVDGYVVSLDTALAIQQKNPDAVLSPAGLEDAPSMELFTTTPDTLEAEPEVVESFLGAIRDATQFVADDADADFDETLKILRDSEDWDFPALWDDEVAKGGLELWTSSAWLDDTGKMPILENDPEQWQEGYDVLSDGGLLEGGGDPGEWLTNDYMP